MIPLSAPELFTIVNLAVLPGWLLLAALPAWKWTRVLSAYAIPGLLSLLYLAVMITDVDLKAGGFGSIEQVGRMFQNEWLLLAGWVHYLAFDLFIGSWEVRDAQRLEVPHVFVLPCLALTFIAGPVGLISYFVVRAAIVRKWPGEEPPRSHRRRESMPTPAPRRGA
jgi:hypothetical protein